MWDIDLETWYYLIMITSTKILIFYFSIIKFQKFDCRISFGLYVSMDPIRREKPCSALNREY